MASTKIAKVATVTEVRQLIVARSWAWCRQNGYNGSDKAYLDALDLSQYRINDGTGIKATVDLAAIVAKLGTDGKLTITTERDHPEYAAYALADAVYGRARALTLVPGTDYTIAEPNADAIDPREYLGRAADSYEFAAPQFTTDEAKAEAQRIVTGALAEAEKLRACGSVENLIRGIGFEAFMPPATTDMVVEVPGFGTVAFTVENDRCGEPRRDRMEVKIRNAIGAKVAEMLEAGTIASAAPVTAAATA